MLDPEPPEPETTQDLVWMLLSNRTDQRRLVLKLVEEFYQEYYQLALGELGNANAARLTVKHAFSVLVSNSHRYDASMDIRDWIQPIYMRELRRSLQTIRIRRLFRLPIKEEQAKFGTGVEDQLDATQLTVLTSGIVDSIQARRRWMKVSAAIQWSIFLSLALFLLFRLGWREDLSLPAPADSPSILSTRLVTQIVRITMTPTVSPTPTITPTHTPFPPNAVLYTIKGGDTLKGIAERTGIHAAIIYALNGLDASDMLLPGQQIVLTIGEIPRVLITPTLVTPLATRQAITAQSSPKEIIQLVNQSIHNWRTLWLDAQIIDYGPTGYIGPPLVEREQVWLISRQEGLLLMGREGDPQPERMVLNLNGTTYDRFPNEGQFFRSNNDVLLGYSQLSPLLDTPFTDAKRERLEVVGFEQIAGRDALVVDRYSIEEQGEYFLGRYSIDTRTGVQLRLRTYWDEEHLVPSQEIRVTDIQYDMDFPAELFDPYAGAISHFAQGPQGGQELPASLASRLKGVESSGGDALPRRTPPPDYDPSRGQLTFQFSSLTRLGGARDMAEVFASSYYLGTLEFADPWNINCTRSPSGRYIAYIPYLEEELNIGSLHWIDLLDLGFVHDPIPDILPAWSNMAFSPDESQLAFVSCSQSPDGGCTIFLLEISSDDIQPLLGVSYASSLAWNPDGSQLAFLGGITRYQDTRVFIVNIYNGEISSSESMNMEDYVLADPNSPINAWGMSFPIWNTGLESCSAPPEK